jgi:alanyl-tRNA synthetase
MQKIQKSDAIILTTVLEDCNVAQLRSLSEIIATQNPTGTIAVMIGKSEDDKVYAILNVSKDRQEKYNAGELLKILLQPLNGKGGGGACSAQGGGTGQDKIPDALQKICNVVL